ncbi:MAG: hypothetical protein AB1649_24560, partial [Chloroflexota bacterium]
SLHKKMPHPSPMTNHCLTKMMNKRLPLSGQLFISAELSMLSLGFPKNRKTGLPSSGNPAFLENIHVI